MEATEEQDRIADSTAKNLVVNAFAGSGKTTTLVEYARRRQNERLMYVAFNRSIKEEAAKKFGKNVRCVTTHGLAYPSFGTKYAHKLNNPRAYHLSNALGLDIVSAGRVLEVITNFQSSISIDIEESHAIAVAPKANASTLANLVDYARRGWEMMQDRNNTVVPMNHDGYLKLYQLSNPTINTGIILFDEAQDANPITLDFISKQRCNKVFVGDKYQSIYGFRGAVDALSKIQADERLMLTSSFRFGHGIANLATAMLQEWRDCQHQIRGLGKHATVFSVDRNRPHAVISRTNGALFGEAVAIVNANKPFGFVGGVEGYRFDQILDTFHQFANHKGSVRDPFIASFEDFGQMKEYGESLDDKEVKSLCKVVEEYGHEIPSLIDKIKTRAIQKLTGNEIELATTHKAKGREWMDVVLTDDFTELDIHLDEKGREERPDPEEINILYVASTRAMRGLQIPEKVNDWLFRTGQTDILNGAKRTQPSQQQVRKESVQPQPERKVEQARQTRSDPELDAWCRDMNSYFDKVRGSYSGNQPSSNRIALFLEEQAAKFRGI